MKLSDIVAFLGQGHRLVGPDIEITGVGNIDGAHASDLSYWVGSTLMDAATISISHAGAVLVSEEIPYSDGLHRPSLVMCPSPRLSMIRVLKRFFMLDVELNRTEPPIFLGGEMLAVQDRKSVTIGFYATIQAIRQPIGNNVTIHDHVCIGGQGFLYARDAEGRRHHFPHLGMVVIGNDVEIFPFTKIDRGTLDDTIIGNGVNIDHHVHIGHNAVVGDDTVILSHAAIGGNAVIGRRCIIGMGALIKDRVTIGDDVTVDMGSVVKTDVPSGTTTRIT